MGIEPTEDASQRPPPVLKTGPRTSQGRATAKEANRFRFGDQWKKARELDGAAAEFPEGAGLAGETEPPDCECLASARPHPVRVRLGRRLARGGRRFQQRPAVRQR